MMRKLLLFVSAVAITFSSIAQVTQIERVAVKKDAVVKKNHIDVINNNATPLQRLDMQAKANLNFTPVLMNHSTNLYGSLVEQQTMLSTNEDLNMVMYTHRGGGGESNGTGGQILATYSTDGGATFPNASNIVYDGTPNSGRYPSGVIYNPAGNEDVENAMAIVAGPALQVGDEGWGFDFFAWKKFGSNDAGKQLFNHGNLNRLSRTHLQVCDNGVAWMTGDANTDDGQYYTGFHFMLYKGVVEDDGTMTWTEDQLVSPNLLQTGSGNPAGRPYGFAAFSQDGQTGYLVSLGIPAGSTQYIYRPIAQKTIDAGETWTDVPDFDFTTLEVFQELFPEEEDMVPFFDIINDAVVDKYGQLHILSYVIPGKHTTDLDSIGYVYPYMYIEGYLFDTYTTDSGWDTEPIDAVHAKNAENAIFGDITIDARPQMGITADGTKIFYTWVDTDPDYSLDNEFPDLYISGYDIDTKKRTNSFNFTKDTDYEAQVYLHATANQVWQDGDKYYIHNALVGMPGSTDLDAVELIYMKGLYIEEHDFVDPEFLGINNIDNNVAQVSQNYPNPANGITNIDISLVKASELSIEIVNMMGQVVYSENKGNVTEGKHKFTFNVSDMSSGIYFYTVKAGNSTVTSKMIVQ